MKKRRRSTPIVAGPQLFMALAALCAGLLWTVSILFFSLQMDSHGDKHNNSSSSNKPLNRLRAYNNPQLASYSNLPPYELQLWPDDSVHSNYFDFLTHCRGDDCHLELENEADKEEPLLVLLIRSPGALGSIVEGFVQAMVDNLNKKSNEHHHKLELQVYRYAPPKEIWTRKQPVKMIRAVTSPLILEAIDLAMLISQRNPDLRITWNHVEIIVRSLVQWQRDINVVANHVPATILTIQSTLLVPQDNEAKLSKFLLGKLPASMRNQDDDEEEQVETVPRDALAKRAMERIDQSTQFLMQLQDDPTLKLAENPKQAALQWMTQEMDQASAVEETAMDHPVAQQVRALLHESDATLCTTYPQLCPDSQQVMMS